MAAVAFRLKSDPAMPARRFNRVETLRRYLDAPWTDRDIKRLESITDRYYWDRYEDDEGPEWDIIDRLREMVRDYKKIINVIETDEKARKLASDTAAYTRIKERRGAIRGRYEAEAEQRYKSKAHRTKLVNKRLAEDREYQALEWEWGQIPNDVKQKIEWLAYDARRKRA